MFLLLPIYFLIISFINVQFLNLLLNFGMFNIAFIIFMYFIIEYFEDKRNTAQIRRYRNLNSLPFWAATGTPQMLEFAIAKTVFLSKVNPSGVRNAMSVFAVESRCRFVPEPRICFSYWIILLPKSFHIPCQSWPIIFPVDKITLLNLYTSRFVYVPLAVVSDYNLKLAGRF